MLVVFCKYHYQITFQSIMFYFHFCYTQFNILKFDILTKLKVKKITLQVKLYVQIQCTNETDHFSILRLRVQLQQSKNV